MAAEAFALLFLQPTSLLKLPNETPIVIPNPGLNQSHLAIFGAFWSYSSLEESLREDVTPPN